jgi:alanyl-tRNA synthetase
MNYIKLRNQFIEFFEKKNHTCLPPSSLIPVNDTSILFTTAGMTQFKKYFTLEEVSPYKRVVTIQPCIRAGGKHNDLDNVGFTKRHHTFFEMMGNFSFYDYFKEEAMIYAIDFLTKELLIPENKLFFTVHEKDTEAYKILRKLTKQPIIGLNSNDNFWSMGNLGPCGYCSEIYYYMGTKANPTEEDFLKGFNESDTLFLEVWNLVFMEFNQTDKGQVNLNKKSIDTGMGLERILSIIEGTMHNYTTSIMNPLVLAAQAYYSISREKINIAYIAADHVKTAVFLLNEGLNIGSEGGPYVLRKIIRRALTYLNLKEPAFYKLAKHVLEIYKGVYVFRDLDKIEKAIYNEEVLFLNTISSGLLRLQNNLENNQINEEVVFKLYETYGLPLDFSTVFLQQQGINLNNDTISNLMENHRKASGQMLNLNFDVPTISSAYDTLNDRGQVIHLMVDGHMVLEVQENEEFLCITNKSPFYGRAGGQEGDKGIIYNESMRAEVMNTTKKNKTIIHHCKLIKGNLKINDQIHMEVEEHWRQGTTIHHTATHLLHALLKKFVSSDISQKGSFISDNRLRFDFNFSRSLTEKEKNQIETTANEIIKQDLKLNIQYMPYEEAIKNGAETLENTEYETQVRVVAIPFVSMELCGGTHVVSTGQIKSFTITSDRGIGSGLRRLEVKCN